MFTNFIKTYGDLSKTGQIPHADLAGIEDVLPTELVELLHKGEGSYMKGFLWIVNPQEFKQIVDDIYVPLSNPAICFARDAFGSLFLWEDNSVIYVDINNSKQEVVGRKINVFFDLKLTDSGFLSKKTAYDKFVVAEQLLGPPEQDECYGYFPLLGMGGAGRIDNLKKVKPKEYLAIVAQTLGKIE